MKIIHLRNNAIDRECWDSHIAQSHNQLTYAYSWYLDVVSPGWEALISKNYEYIMPLPLKSKFKIPYLVQPILTQQLGIFSKHKINEDIIEEFIKEIPYFSYEINLNEHNSYSKALVYPNFTLNLNQPYNQIASSYTKNTQRNIEKADKLNLQIKFGLSTKEFLDFYSSVEKNYSSITLSTLEKLINAGIAVNALTLYGVYSKENNLIAGLCLLKSCNTLTNLLPVSSPEGKAASAMFFLIDFLIRKEGDNFKTFDFEGSKIEGVARFYKGFGAVNHPYYILKRLRPTFLINQ
ncbi:MAG TPA: hypothetical protein VFK73_06110 [Paludibacter sp.]|nr:hypothetical protein [Paludibacter sp.]